ncbi:MAG: tRNA 2-selenouridine(34) synthase MnmH [Ginsengibacter sp.]
MSVEKIDIEFFLRLSKECPVLDVRSPAEFNHAHIPGTYSIPLFTDEQRAVVGTAYVKESRKIAVDHGLNYFSERMKIIPGEVSSIVSEWQKKNTNISSFPSGSGSSILIHCWRGGMRSEAVAWLMNLYGYKIYILKGGYKAFRRWALSQFEKKYSLKVLGGFTGSGKTDILKELKQKGKAVIDLEALANHKGSAFGALGEEPQPGHEMFENLIALELFKIRTDNNTDELQTKDNDPEIWIEDESVHIGKVGIPKAFWQEMRNSPLFFIDIPFEERVNYIVKTYGIFDNKLLAECVLKIQKRLGGLDTKNAIHFLSENNLTETFSILLKYYDKTYEKSLNKRENIHSLLNKVTCKKVENSNAEKLMILK